LLRRPLSWFFVGALAPPPADTLRHVVVLVDTMYSASPSTCGVSRLPHGKGNPHTPQPAAPFISRWHSEYHVNIRLQPTARSCIHPAGQCAAAQPGPQPRCWTCGMSRCVRLAVAGCRTLLALEQTMVPAVPLPGPVQRCLGELCSRQISSCVADLDTELRRRKGGGLPRTPHAMQPASLLV
jgi:hypothetical protein